MFNSNFVTLNVRLEQILHGGGRLLAKTPCITFPSPVVHFRGQNETKNLHKHVSKNAFLWIYSLSIFFYFFFSFVFFFFKLVDTISTVLQLAEPLGWFQSSKVIFKIFHSINCYTVYCSIRSLTYLHDHSKCLQFSSLFREAQQPTSTDCPI